MRAHVLSHWEAPGGVAVPHYAVQKTRSIFLAQEMRHVMHIVHGAIFSKHCQQVLHGLTQIQQVQHTNLHIHSAED